MKTSAPRRARVALVSTLLAAALIAPVAHGQGFIYGLNETGKLTANGTILDALPSGYNPGNFFNTFHQRWWELVVDGADRYALRQDGRVFKNGSSLHKLDFTFGEGVWVGMVVVNGSLWTLRTDGLLAQDGVATIDFSEGDFFFQTLVSDGTTVYALRSDGAVYVAGQAAPLFQLDGGLGVNGDDDGEEPDTWWRTATFDSDGKLYAIRHDGKIVFADPAGEGGDPPSGTLEADLPFVLDGPQSQFYADIMFLDDGNWYAVRADGFVYSALNHVTEIVNLPGSPVSNVNAYYIDLLPMGTEFLTLRLDGLLFRDTDTDILVDLTRAGYRRLAFSDTEPDLTTFKNQRPVTVLYTIFAVVGEPVTFPVLATDVDLDTADLVVTEDTDRHRFPDGAIYDWDDVARTFTWNTPGPKGGHTFAVLVEDGVNKPVSVRYRIRVSDPDAKPDKNKPPNVSRVRKIQALAGTELCLPMFATDRDGDTITFSVDTDEEPFLTLGATFDPGTNVFKWTPTFEDLGRHKVTFFVTDGEKTRKLRVRIDVVASLLGFG